MLLSVAFHLIVHILETFQVSHCLCSDRKLSSKMAAFWFCCLNPLNAVTIHLFVRDWCIYTPDLYFP